SKPVCPEPVQKCPPPQACKPVCPEPVQKCPPIQGIFRIKPKQAPLQATRDVIIRCQTLTYRNNIFTAIKGKTQLESESASFNFYQDLTRITLQWTRNLHPVTHRLQNANVP
ncbi:Hypothetical predicted protein, partial [Pelobates cultripes]